jgi:hypothetical protein
MFFVAFLSSESGKKIIELLKESFLEIFENCRKSKISNTELCRLT